MSKVIDVSGERFGQLTCIRKMYVKNKNSYWLCKCDCGKETIVSLNNLRRLHTKSCGCYKEERIKRQNGLCNTRIYHIYYGVKQRCYNQNAKNYKNYGGRGITMCDEWRNNFKAFYDWSMSHGYSYDLTIDRVDVNGNYEPSNCRWVDMKTQQNNRRNNHFITCDGVTKTISEWSDVLNINKETIRYNINKNSNYIYDKLNGGGLYHV